MNRTVSWAYAPLVPGVQMLTSPVVVPDAPRNTNAPRTQAVSVYAAPAVTGMVCAHSPVVVVGVPTSALVPVRAGVPVPVSAVQVQPAVPDSNPGLATSSTAPAGERDPTSSPAVTIAAVAPTASAARIVRIATPRPLVRTGSQGQRDLDRLTNGLDQTGPVVVNRPRDRRRVPSTPPSTARATAGGSPLHPSGGRPGSGHRHGRPIPAARPSPVAQRHQPEAGGVDQHGDQQVRDRQLLGVGRERAGPGRDPVPQQVDVLEAPPRPRLRPRCSNNTCSIIKKLSGYLEYCYRIYR